MAAAVLEQGLRQKGARVVSRSPGGGEGGAAEEVGG